MPEDVSGFEGRGGLDLVEDTGLALFLDLGEESRQTLVAKLKPGERDGRSVGILQGHGVGNAKIVERD